VKIIPQNYIRLSKVFDFWQKIPFLGKIVVGMSTALLALALLFPPKKTEVDLEGVHFSTANSSKMYFKNVRSYYYRIQEDKQSGFVLYRHKGFSYPENTDGMRLMIVENWREDEAYLFFEFSDDESAFFLKVATSDSLMPLNQVNTTLLYQSGKALYQAASKGQSHEVFSEFGISLPLPTERRYQRALQATLEDYFRLTGRGD
jgi:hypothetical protein